MTGPSSAWQLIGLPCTRCCLPKNTNSEGVVLCVPPCTGRILADCSTAHARTGGDECQLILWDLCSSEAAVVFEKQMRACRCEFVHNASSRKHVVVRHEPWLHQLAEPLPIFGDNATSLPLTHEHKAKANTLLSTHSSVSE